MFVVFNTETGWSSESMRFTSRAHADMWIVTHTDEDRGDYFDVRLEA